VPTRYTHTNGTAYTRGTYSSKHTQTQANTQRGPTKVEPFLPFSSFECQYKLYSAYKPICTQHPSRWRCGLSGQWCCFVCSITTHTDTRKKRRFCPTSWSARTHQTRPEFTGSLLYPLVFARSGKEFVPDKYSNHLSGHHGSGHHLTSSVSARCGLDTRGLLFITSLHAR